MVRRCFADVGMIFLRLWPLQVKVEQLTSIFMMRFSEPRVCNSHRAISRVSRRLYWFHRGTFFHISYMSFTRLVWDTDPKSTKKESTKFTKSTSHFFLDLFSLSLTPTRLEPSLVFNHYYDTFSLLLSLLFGLIFGLLLACF